MHFSGFYKVNMSCKENHALTSVNLDVDDKVHVKH